MSFLPFRGRKNSKKISPRRATRAAAWIESLEPRAYLIATADLMIADTDNQPTAVPGTAITYTITVSNPGPSAAPVTSISDALPAGSLFTATQSGGATGATSGSGSISQDVDLPIAGSVTYLATVSIPSSATGTLINTASVVTSVNDPNSTIATDVSTLTPQTNLTISDTDDTNTGEVQFRPLAVPGKSIFYTIAVSNPGPSDAPVNVIQDVLPAGSVFAASESGGATGATNGSGDINQSIDLPAGSSVTYAVTVTIPSSATGTLTNTASLATSVSDPSPTSVTDTDTLSPQANLTISDTDNQATVVPGAAVTYTITASNIGPSDAPGTTISDTTLNNALANYSVLFTATESGGATGASDGSQGINQTVNLPAGSSVTYMLVATGPASATGFLTNTAMLTPAASVNDSNAGTSTTDLDSINVSNPVSVTLGAVALSVAPGTTSTRRVNVRLNNGALMKPAGVIKVQLELSPTPNGLDSNGQPNTIPLGSATLETNLFPRQSKELAVPLGAIPATLPFGNYYLEAVVTESGVQTATPFTSFPIVTAKAGTPVADSITASVTNAANIVVQAGVVLSDQATLNFTNTGVPASVMVTAALSRTPDGKRQIRLGIFLTTFAEAASFINTNFPIRLGPGIVFVPSGGASAQIPIGAPPLTIKAGAYYLVANIIGKGASNKVAVSSTPVVIVNPSSISTSPAMITALPPVGANTSFSAKAGTPSRQKFAIQLSNTGGVTSKATAVTLGLYTSGGSLVEELTPGKANVPPAGKSLTIPVRRIPKKTPPGTYFVGVALTGDGAPLGAAATILSQFTAIIT